MSEWKERLGKKFARVTTDRVVAHPRLWPVFRGLMRAQFDGIARSWEGRQGPEALAPLAEALERVETVTRALDLGTGTGKAARMVAQRFPSAHVVGVDLAPGMVEEARRLLPGEIAGRVRFEVADASRLGFGDGEFDLVVMLNMIPFFDEVARVTAPGGSVVVAYAFGASTPIYVPPDVLRRRFAAVGLTEMEELQAGQGTAAVARRVR
jgi:SAM-dependent methyltransferase